MHPLPSESLRAHQSRTILLFTLYSTKHRKYRKIRIPKYVTTKNILLQSHMHYRCKSSLVQERLLYLALREIFMEMKIQMWTRSLTPSCLVLTLQTNLIHQFQRIRFPQRHYNPHEQSMYFKLLFRIRYTKKLPTSVSDTTGI